MAASINFSALTFTADEVRELSSLIQQKVLAAPAIEQAFTTYLNIKNDENIGLIKPTLGLIGVADAGCGAGSNVTGQMTTTQKQWSPKRVSIIKDECYTDLSTNLAKFYRKSGTSISDLTGTEYMDYLMSFIPNDVTKMIWRKAWFEDTAADTVTNGGKLTNGTDKGYFNLFNGIFKQILTIVATATTQKVAITENAAASTALQFSSLTPQNAYLYFTKLVDAAPVTLLGESDRMFICTRSIAQKAARYLQSVGQDTVLQKLEGGYELGMIDSIPVLVVPVFDEIISAYYNNGTTLDSPHRIVLTTKSNLGVGFESSTGFSELKVIFDEMTEKNRIKLKDAMDAKVIDDTMVMIAI